MQRISPLLALVAIASAFVTCVSCTGFYTIVAPENIRPHSDYQVSITLHDSIEPATIQLSIEDIGLKYKNQQKVTINSNQTELVKLRIDELDVTKGYKFVAEGLSGFVFKNSSKLKVESKNVSIFIQTDKAIYKPGETIKFRVLVLDSELKPAKLTSDSLLSVYLTDPEKNRIKQWIKIEPKRGVFTSEVQLSELPVLGDWKFEANVGHEKKTKSVEVTEYVLPKFDVSIDSPKDFSVKDGKVRAIIRSKYTYGKLVKGEAVVTLEPRFGYSSVSHFSRYREGSYHELQMIKTIKIDGKGTVEFDTANEAISSLVEYSSAQYILRAIVIEGLTGRNQSVSKLITIHKNRYWIKSSGLNHEFSPGLPVTFDISVSRQDDSPVLITDETRSIIVGKYIERYQLSERVTYYKFELMNNGTAKIHIPTLRNETNFNLEVKYVGEKTDLGFFYPLVVSEPSELEAKVLTKRPTLNQNVFIEVQSKNELKNFTYQLISRGRIIHAENVEVPDRKYHVFKFKATFDLVPRATLIVYRFKYDDIIATRTDISIEDDLNNFIKLKPSATEVQPGKDVNIEIVTNSDSYVGLVGVDQSVLLLKKNEGLTKSDAMRELEEYRYYHHQADVFDIEPRYSNEYFRTFELSDVILFTNAKHDVFKYHKHLYAMAADSYGGHYYSLREGMPGASYESSGAVATDRMAPVPLIPVPMPMMPSVLSSEPEPEPPRVRSEFPETWLWEDIDVQSPNGTFTVVKQVPDTITSWVISAFSLNDKYGLGLTKNDKSIKVFQPFFVSLNLPYSVKRGEVVAVPVILFNYLEKDITADLTLHNENDEFEFVDDNQDKLLRKREVKVASNTGISSTFLVRFTSVGQIQIKVTALSSIAGDAVVRILQVDPEGVPQFINKPVFVDLRETDKLEIDQNVEVPENIVPGSLKINVNAIGDLLGGVIQNLHQLIRLPTGCGEQNMLKFVPNVVVLDYLTAAGNLDSSIKDKALKYLVKGYQNELNYRHNNGSFSAFGKLDRFGSTWLTAFVAKSFKQAENYIDIDEKVIDQALHFLNATQATDGSFPEIGDIFMESMQGGANKGVALTSYVAITFLKNKKSNGWNYQETVDKAIANVVSNAKKINNPYSQAIAAYALQLADHPKKDEILDELVSKSIEKDQHKFWSKKQPGFSSTSINVEITSYGLLALMKANRYAEGLPYFKWLLAQRNDRGGFFGTQDTVMGLEALATYGKYLTIKDNAVQLKVHADSIEDKLMSVKSENALVLQTIELPSDTKSVHLTATGHGFALFQLSYRYNLNKSDVAIFNLKPKVLETTAGHLNVEVCASFNPKTQDTKHSNMVIMEVAMPSGFLVDKDRLIELSKKPRVKLTEMRRGETVADIYIDQMLPNEQLCLEVQGYRTHKVAENKPAPVRIYDYYDSSRSAKEFYEIPFITSCEICEGDECSKSCKK